MKPPKIALLFWTFNAMLLALAFVMVQAGFSSAQAARRADMQLQAAPAARVNWESPARAPALELADVPLSPRARPVPPKQPVIEVPVIQPEPTDAELQAELQASLNQRYRLQRTITWVSGSDKPGAFVLCAGTKLFVFEGMNLKDLKGVEASARADIDVKSIAVDHVVVNAASARVPSKRFDVKLELGKPAESLAYRWMGSMEIVPPGGAEEELAPYGYWKDRGEMPYPCPDGPGMERNQADKLVDEAARYVRVTQDGLQLTDALPEDSELIKQGARRGDMLKSINGQSARSMSDVRRIVRTGYDAGVREFKIDFERDGIPQTKQVKLK